MDGLRGDIRLNHLTFLHRGHSEPTLKDISLDIKAGTTLAVIGRTGNGKSTLVNLLLHLYHTRRGMIYLDGRDINDIPLKTLRENIAYVPQDNFLFSDTLKSNIAFGTDDEEMEEIVRATKTACIHENIIAFPDGYDTIVGERGVGLSGGQKQRISLARAMAIKPSILILDDTTSAVDLETEKHIQESLEHLEFTCTKIIIAQRISSTRKADRILVLKDGRIEEEGTHAELIAKKGYYYELVKLQGGEEMLLAEEARLNKRSIGEPDKTGQALKGGAQRG